MDKKHNTIIVTNVTVTFPTCALSLLRQIPSFQTISALVPHSLPVSLPASLPSLLPFPTYSILVASFLKKKKKKAVLFSLISSAYDGIIFAIYILWCCVFIKKKWKASIWLYELLQRTHFFSFIILKVTYNIVYKTLDAWKWGKETTVIITEINARNYITREPWQNLLIIVGADR